MSEPQDQKWLELALAYAQHSVDPSTRVGSLLVLDGVPIAGGWNGFADGLHETEERLNDRDTKLELMVHAEMRAILNCARKGIAVKGATLYIVATDVKTQQTWGGPPCVRCAVECLQAGIMQVVSWPFKDTPSRWTDNLKSAAALLAEAHVTYRTVPKR